MNEDDAFRRLRIKEHDLPRAHELIAQYHEGLAHQHAAVARLEYELGRIDERMGDTA